MRCIGALPRLQSFSPSSVRLVTKPLLSTLFVSRPTCSALSRSMSTKPDSTSIAPMFDPNDKVKVYTKTGDKGTSVLYNMQRISKASDYFHALGDTDELNGHIGLAREYALRSNVGIDDWLTEIQSRLLDAGSCIATPLSSSPENRVRRTRFPEDAVDALEQWIDKMEESLPPLSNFILPSGGLAASAFHVCRSVTRRAERNVVALVERGDTDAVVMKYLNRLSDFFFVAARYAALKDGQQEVVYKKAVDRSHRKPSTEAAAESTVSATTSSSTTSEDGPNKSV